MAFLPQIGVPIPIYEEGRLYVNLLCTGPGLNTRAIAFGIYWPVTQVKTGVQCAQNEDNGSFAADFRQWIPAFAGMAVAGSAGSKSKS